MDRRPDANGSARDPMSAPPRRLAAAGLVALLLAGCAVDAAPEIAAAPYPDLHNVPSRPTVDFTLEQRGEIARALERDRLVAAHDSAALRAELGLGVAPSGARPERLDQPQPVPGGVPGVAPPRPPEPLPPGGGVVAELVVRQQVLVERNNGRLESFTRILERQLELDRRLEEAGLGRLADPLEDGLGAPVFEPVETVRFAMRSSELPEDVDDRLRAAIVEATRSRGTLAVVGQGTPTVLALNRARAVASRLMRLGAPRAMLSLRLGGSGDEVTLHLLAADAA